VFSSTCATYGVPEKLPIREDALQQPISPYGHSKLAVEWMLRDSACAWGLGACALRYFNACGAAADASIGEDHDPEIHLIPLVLQAAAGRREHISVFGTDYPTPDGTCVRDYIHVEDLAEAHLLALEALGEGRFDAYNLGTGQGTSVRQIIDAAQRVTGRTINVRTAERRPGDPPELYADASRIRAALGWQPRYTRIDDVIATAWAWHSRHPDGY
jgi:UDP-glucose-4-epimerase GalE